MQSQFRTHIYNFNDYKISISLISTVNMILLSRIHTVCTNIKLYKVALSSQQPPAAHQRAALTSGSLKGSTSVTRGVWKLVSKSAGFKKWIFCSFTFFTNRSKQSKLFTVSFLPVSVLPCWALAGLLVPGSRPEQWDSLDAGCGFR